MSAEMIALVRARGLANVEARVHDLAEPLDWLASASVDLVVSSLALHYLEDWDALFIELRRVVRPGGRIVFSVHHPAMTAPLVRDYFETQPVRDVWTIGGVEREVRFVHRSMEAIVAPLLGAGFALVRLIEPRLDPATATSAQEIELATQPWFLIIEARA